MNPLKDWYMCSKCYNQGYVDPNCIPNPNWNGGCGSEGIKGLTGSHKWEKLTLYQNYPTCLQKYPQQYFEIM